MERAAEAIRNNVTTERERQRHRETTELERQHRRRVQLDFSQEAYDRMLGLRDKAGARTNAEVVRNALRLYAWFLEQKEEGYAVNLVKGDSAKEVEFIF